MEIHALEWKSEDIGLQERQKRENIRRAVHEFIPPSGAFLGPPLQHPQSSADVSKDRDLHYRQASTIDSRFSILNQTSYDSASRIPRAISLPQNRQPVVYPPENATTMSTSSSQEEISRPFSSSNSKYIYFPRKGRSSGVEETVNPAIQTEELETTSSTRSVFVK